MKALMKEGLSSMENLKTQTVKHTYLVTLTTSDTAACLGCQRTAAICAESVSAALREFSAEFEHCDACGAYDVAVSLADAPERELYANTLVAPDAYTFLRKCAEDAAWR